MPIHRPYSNSLIEQPYNRTHVPWQCSLCTCTVTTTQLICVRCHGQAARIVKVNKTGGTYRKSKQDRQCVYNVTLRRVHEPLLMWKSNKYFLLLSVCVRACVRVCVRARACMWVLGRAGVCMKPCLSCRQLLWTTLWRHSWPLCLHHTFRHYHLNGAIFGKTLFSMKYVFWFSL
jgi:hypothetical protein